MSFFKKALKKINLRGSIKAVLKVGSFIPAVGTYVDKASKLIDKTGVLAKKKNRAIADNNVEQAEEYDRQLQDTHEKVRQVQNDAYQELPEDVKEQHNAQRKNPGLMDFIKGLAGGAAHGLGNVLAQTNEAGEFGANVADSTLSAWFKKHWGIVAGVGTGIAVLITVLLTRRPKYGRR
jgi:ElaB/YqjD/DUF883 family membrane-anchored ribosome-binding protein